MLPNSPPDSARSATRSAPAESHGPPAARRDRTTPLRSCRPFWPPQYTDRQLPPKILARVITGTAVVLTAALLLRYAGDGLHAYFTADDVMNLYVAVFRRA